MISHTDLASTQVGSIRFEEKTSLDRKKLRELEKRVKYLEKVLRDLMNGYTTLPPEEG